MGLRCGPNDPWVHSQCLVPYVLLIFLRWVSWPCENDGHSILESLEQQPASYSISEMKRWKLLAHNRLTCLVEQWWDRHTSWGVQQNWPIKTARTKKSISSSKPWRTTLLTTHWNLSLSLSYFKVICWYFYSNIYQTIFPKILFIYPYFSPRTRLCS